MKNPDERVWVLLNTERGRIDCINKTWKAIEGVQLFKESCIMDDDTFYQRLAKVAQKYEFMSLRRYFDDAMKILLGEK